MRIPEPPINLSAHTVRPFPTGAFINLSWDKPETALTPEFYRIEIRDAYYPIDDFNGRFIDRRLTKQLNTLIELKGIGPFEIRILSVMSNGDRSLPSEIIYVSK